MSDKPTTSVDAAKQPPKDPNAEPLSPKSKEPQTATDPKMQEGANKQVEELRTGNVFGDNTSSSGDQNVIGLHGRDGGVRGAPEGGGPNNPQAAKEVTDTSEAAKGEQNNEG